MKKTIFAAFMLLIGIASAKADNDRPINFNQLPEVSQEFLTQHFGNLTLAYATEDMKYVGSEYEVVYTDRTEIDFDTKGQWTSVERRYEAVPAEIIPAEIARYLSTSDLAKGQHVRKISRDRLEWEVELSNGFELEFDNQFNILRIDD